jgi:enoyl-CoA hydratase
MRTNMNYENILVSLEPPIAIVQFNRPKVLNALNSKLIAELVDALQSLDRDDSVRCIVLTGNERAFAAGADVSEMAGETAADLLLSERFAAWARIRNVRKPIIAAVSGYALGGGCEIAMTCDMIVASESARFGQPEINLGIIPGAGGTQRLTRAVGKARAMEMVLTGKPITAQEAERFGLVNRVVPVERYLEEARAVAREIAAQPPVAIMLAKEAVNKAFETSLSEGLEFERRNFYLLFATEDQKEGMRAFMEKRRAEWKGR